MLNKIRFVVIVCPANLWEEVMNGFKQDGLCIQGGVTEDSEHLQRHPDNIKQPDLRKSFCMIILVSWLAINTVRILGDKSAIAAAGQTLDKTPSSLPAVAEQDAC